MQKHQIKEIQLYYPAFLRELEFASCKPLTEFYLEIPLPKPNGVMFIPQIFTYIFILLINLATPKFAFSGLEADNQL